MKKNGFFAGLALCLIMFVQPLSALPTELELLFEFGGPGAGPGDLNITPGIAVNGHDEIVVTDAIARRVSVFDRCGNFLFNFEGAPQFNEPTGVAVTEDNNIVVVDTLKDNVQVYDRCGNFIFEFGESGDGPGQFNRPTRVAVNGWGEIAVNSTNNNDIQVFDRCGNFLFCIEDNPPLWPIALAYDNDGNLYVGSAFYEDNISVYDHCGTAGRRPHPSF